MGYGNGNKPVAESGRRVVRFKSLYKRAFSSIYANADSTSGNCSITSSSRRLTNADGVLTYKKGYPKATFESDDRRTLFSFSLSEVSSESVASGVHRITIP